MKYTGPKIKKARRLGIALSPKSERYLEKDLILPDNMGQIVDVVNSQITEDS